MPIMLEPMLLVPLVTMVIPIAILIGQRAHGGPLVGISAGALLGIIVYLALMWSWLWSSDGIYSTLQGVSLGCGVTLLLGAFALVFADALHRLPRGWAITFCAGLCAAAYTTVVALMGLTIIPLRSCMYFPVGSPTCAPPNTGRFLLLGALSLIGPCAMLIYALRAHGSAAPATSTLPDGLTISRLDAEEI